MRVVSGAFSKPRPLPIGSINRDLWRPRAADDKYHALLLGLGPREKIGTVDNLDVFAVSVAARKTRPPRLSPE